MNWSDDSSIGGEEVGMCAKENNLKKESGQHLKFFDEG